MADERDKVRWKWKTDTMCNEKPTLNEKHDVRRKKDTRLIENIMIDKNRHTVRRKRDRMLDTDTMSAKTTQYFIKTRHNDRRKTDKMPEENRQNERQKLLHTIIDVEVVLCIGESFLHRTPEEGKWVSFAVCLTGVSLSLWPLCVDYTWNAYMTWAAHSPHKHWVHSSTAVFILCINTKNKTLEIQMKKTAFVADSYCNDANYSYGR